MKKKLIEVALPLRAINISTAKEKSLRHGHPSTIHRWWSRKPLSAARAVVFASLVDDPSSRPDLFPSETLQNVERQRLFRLIERLVLWENVGNRALLDEALKEISASAGVDLPTIYDPFSGGGSIPLEAQRLGLQAHGSDLNPVAVLISKALVELPPNFVDTYPVNPDSNSVSARRKLLRGIPGLAADIRFYGKWLKDEANARLAHLYPKVRHPDNPGMEYTAIAWLWVRVVPCPNPACRGQVPLLSKAWLSTKAHKKTWVELVLDHKSRTVTFDICSGLPGPEQARRLSAGTAATNEQGKKTKATFFCPFCSSPGNATTVRGEYVDRCANEGTMRSLPLAIAAEGVRGRLYVPFHDKTQLGAVEQADIEVAQGLMDVEPPNEATRGTFASNAQGRYYGFRKYRDYFTNRQLRYLTTVCGLQKALRDRIILDGADERRANALITYLALVFGRTLDRSSALCVWDASPKMEALRNTFALQGIQMAWDYAEGNPFSQSSGSWMNNVEWVAKVVEKLPGATESHIYQRDIVGDRRKQQRFVIITDPPYYDNIEYSHLSDFFYVWFRPMLIGTYPELFSTLLVPKTNELVASATGHDGDGQLAKESFRRGFQTVFATFREEHDWNYPCVIFWEFRLSSGHKGLRG